jgi:AhpD family alkylhydroperoxidase
MLKNLTQSIAAIVITVGVVTGASIATASPEVDAALADMQSTFGSVPTFVKALPQAALPGMWRLSKDLELSDKTALSPKVKSLISLAVASQIPCTYCIWADTNSARQFGATDEEIAEAVAMAGVTRMWSTTFNGLQVDFDQFKMEMGGQ